MKLQGYQDPCRPAQANIGNMTLKIYWIITFNDSKDQTAAVRFLPTSVIVVA
jgi:hypothetical protein